jgi:hypothetical protein
MTAGGKTWPRSAATERYRRSRIDIRDTGRTRP